VPLIFGARICSSHKLCFEFYCEVIIKIIVRFNFLRIQRIRIGIGFGSVGIHGIKDKHTLGGMNITIARAFWAHSQRWHMCRHDPPGRRVAENMLSSLNAGRILKISPVAPPGFIFSTWAAVASTYQTVASNTLTAAAIHAAHSIPASLFDLIAIIAAWKRKQRNIVLVSLDSLGHHEQRQDATGYVLHNHQQAQISS
jgi:hypothetical protein